MDIKKAFEILGLEPSASENEIKTSYRNLARDAHPDAGGSEKQMKSLN